jgi:hypothetical protein
VRASWGVFDAPRDAENFTDGALGLGFNPHGSLGYTNGVAAFQLASGPPAGSVVFPTLATLSPEIQNFNSAEYYPRTIPITYVQQFLFSVQHELPAGVLVDTSYVYTRGTNLNFATDINQALPGSFSCTTYNCGNPNPVFNAITAQIYDGWSNYNAFQLRLQKRASYGLTFLFNYALSKSLDTGTGNGHGSGIDAYQDAYHPIANYGLSDFNSTNTLVGQVLYELPFGAGKQFALHGVADEIAGGWRLSSLFQWHSGVPFTPVVESSIADGVDPGLTPSFNAGSLLYPNLVGNPHVSNPSVNEWFNTAAFAAPTSGTFGNLGRNTLYGPGFSNVNLSIAKNFRLPREGMSLEFRADAYDLFNHTNYHNPNAALGASDFGEITDSAGYVATLRVLQLGLHFRF